MKLNLLPSVLGKISPKIKSKIVKITTVVIAVVLATISFSMFVVDYGGIRELYGYPEEEYQYLSEQIKKVITDKINTEPLAKIDYVEVVDWKTLEPVETIEAPILTPIAVYIGKTRLIDNFII